MVPKSGTQLPNSRKILSDADLAAQIGHALRTELGASRRATKSVMRWTGVSDKTARTWLHGGASPSGLHLIYLAQNSPMVMTVLLELTGHGELRLGLQLQEIEQSMVGALEQIRALLQPAAADLSGPSVQ